MKRVEPAVLRSLSIVGVGAVGGFDVCCLLLTFGFFIGHSGHAGQEYLGLTNATFVAWLSATVGLVLGAVLFPIGYDIMGRRLPLKRGAEIFLVAGLLGGLIGAFDSPQTAALLGTAAFLATALAVRVRVRSAASG